MVEVEINGEKLSVDETSTILDALNSAGAPYAKDCKIIAVRRGEVSEIPKDFLIETDKGKFSIKMADPLLPLWLKHYRDFQRIKIGWITRNVVTFGPVDLTPSRLKATDQTVKYRPWEVFLSFGGFDPANTYLCFSKFSHEGVYGAPSENLGIIGKVIKGGHVISELGRGDSILRVHPSSAEKEEVLVLGLEEIEKRTVEKDMQIWTRVEATLDERAPNCDEHFLAAVREGFFQIDRASTVFVCNEKFAGLPLQKENTVYRPKGSITIRNAGTKSGAIYVYRKDAPFTPSHSLVGRVTCGIKLVEYANPGDKILIKTIPGSLMVMGMTQKQAGEYLSQRGIKHVRVGDEDDDAMIIEQRPRSTMEVKEYGSAVTLGVSPKLICRVNIWDKDSPQSALHFRTVADMVHSPIGKLRVLAISEEALILSSSKDTRTIKSLPAEKTPSDEVQEGMIGVTNSLRKLTGVIGIRLKADKTYGPTGETFEATNIIGNVTDGLDLLKNRSVEDTIYFLEEK